MTFEDKQHNDFDRIIGIVDSLFYLKNEAQKTGNEDVRVLIESTFNILMTTYCMLIRDNQREILKNSDDCSIDGKVSDFIKFYRTHSQ